MALSAGYIPSMKNLARLQRMVSSTRSVLISLSQVGNIGCGPPYSHASQPTEQDPVFSRVWSGLTFGVQYHFKGKISALAIHFSEAACSRSSFITPLYMVSFILFASDFVVPSVPQRLPFGPFRKIPLSTLSRKAAFLVAMTFAKLAALKQNWGYFLKTFKQAGYLSQQMHAISILQ